jgi:hypothetical protein
MLPDGVSALNRGTAQATWRREWPALLLGALICATGCTRSDDEIWREHIESTPVYLYAALKVAVSDPNRDPDVAEVHRLLNTLENQGAAKDKPLETLLQAGSEALALPRALLGLRSIGKSEVALGRNSTLRILFTTEHPTPANLSSDTSRDFEHGVLLLLLLTAKLDSQAPTPIPEEIPLYEAYMAGEGPGELPALTQVVRAAQAFTTAGAGLCDVAVRFTDTLAGIDLKPNPTAATALLDGLFLSAIMAANPHTESASEAALALTLAQALPWGLRLLAHTRTALCFDGRDDVAKARIEWDRSAEVALDAGLPKADVALVQAYAAYRADDYGRAREHLLVGSQSELLTPEERRDLQQLAERLDPNQRGMADGVLDRIFIARITLQAVNKRLSDAGVYRELSELPNVQRAKQAVESISGLGSSASKGFWQRIQGWFDRSRRP